MAEYRIPYRIGPRTVITHAHRAPLIDFFFFLLKGNVAVYKVLNIEKRHNYAS